MGDTVGPVEGADAEPGPARVLQDAAVSLALGWLGRNWVTGAAFMAGGFICLVPLLTKLLPLPMLLIYLHTPGYMIHEAAVQQVHIRRGPQL